MSGNLVQQAIEHTLRGLGLAGTGMARSLCLSGLLVFFLFLFFGGFFDDGRFVVVGCLGRLGTTCEV